MQYIYKRKVLSRISEMAFQGRAIIIYGARRTGKTTLVREFLRNFSSDDVIYLNCDEPDVRIALENRTSTELGGFFGRKKIIVMMKPKECLTSDFA